MQMESCNDEIEEPYFEEELDPRIQVRKQLPNSDLRQIKVVLIDPNGWSDELQDSGLVATGAGMIDHRGQVTVNKIKLSKVGERINFNLSKCSIILGPFADKHDTSNQSPLPQW